MKCPKCGYLGFEDVERCRNCGYDFSLTRPAPEPDLSMRRAANTPRPLDDLALVDAAGPLDDVSSIGPDLDAVLGAPVSAKSSPRDLPLFAADDDRPLITRPSPPRPPLAVRRATPEVPRVRGARARPPSLDLGFESDAGGVATVAAAASRSPVDAHANTEPPYLAPLSASSDDAGVATRFVAVAIDLLILAVVDAVVVYFTMQICGLTIADIGLLPKAPLAAFLLVQNGGYLVAFTAGGQTLGKMATGIRVVANEADATLDLGRAFVRTIVWLLLAVPGGLGFFTAVLSRDRRGLHDRFAGTRVVR